MEKLRMYFHILGCEIYYQEVSSPKEAFDSINAIANFILFAIDKGIIPDHCNAAGLEVWDDDEQEWLEWYDEDGLDLFDHFEVESSEV